MKGVIAIPTTERNNFSWAFIQSLLGIKAATGHKVIHSNIGMIDIARNQLMHAVLKNDADYVVFIDSDMTFEPNAVEQLLGTMELFGAHIGTGLYFKGDVPHDPVAFDFNTEQQRYLPITEWGKARLIDACGMGFCIIKKELFGVQFAFTTMDTPIGKKLLGEDVTFCRRAQAKGYKIVLDPEVKLGHLRTIAIDEDYIKKQA